MFHDSENYFDMCPLDWPKINVEFREIDNVTVLPNNCSYFLIILISHYYSGYYEVGNNSFIPKNMKFGLCYKATKPGYLKT